MSVLLSGIIETGGDFITRAVSGGIISSGVTGTILTLTPPAGQRVRLTNLSTIDGSTQSGISVLFGAVTVIDEQIVNGAIPRVNGDNFSIGSYQAYVRPATIRPPSANYYQLAGSAGQVVTITKNSGNTTSDVYYGYEFGE